MTKERKIFRIYNIILGAFVLLPFSIIITYNIYIYNAFEIKIKTNEKDYLTSLRSANLGWKTVLLRKPQILFIGDSHTGAAWDHAGVQAHTGKRVGTFNLPSMHVEFLPQVLEILEDKGVIPDHLILGTSPRMYWNPSEYVVKSNKRQLGALANRHPIFTLGDPLLDLDPNEAGLSFSRPYEQFWKIVAERQLKWQAISDEDIRAVLLASLRNGKFKRFLDGMLKFRNSAVVQDATLQVCDWVKRLGVRFSVVHLPESPFLEELYPLDLQRMYDQEIERFRKCSALLVKEKAKAYGLNDRDFIDSKIISGEADYQQWMRRESLTDAHKFDPDHMNPIGARKFTGMLLERIF